MPPFASGNVPVALSAPNDTVLVLQDPNGPWTMDLNTSVTIVFGILGLIFQAWQIWYGRRQITRTSLHNEGPRNTDMVLNIPTAPMPQRGQARPFHGSRGYSQSMHPQQWSSPREAPAIRNTRQPDRMFGRCAQPPPPPPDIIRKRNAAHYSKQSQWGGASGVSDRARHLSQHNIDQNAQCFGRGYD